MYENSVGSEKSLLPKEARLALVRVALKEDDILDRLESASRDPFGRNRHIAHSIDREILRGVADGDEIDNEDRICRHTEENFIEPDQVIESEVYDVHEECQCVDNESCMICCTQFDLMAFPELKKAQCTRITEDDFHVIVPIELAEQLGFTWDHK